MKNFKNYFVASAIALALFSCSSDDNAISNDAQDLRLEFHNTFADKPLVLGGKEAATATKNTSAVGQTHYFSELKYVISNIRLIQENGTEIPYHVDDLDQGAFVVDQAKEETRSTILNAIPKGTYKQIKFGLGVQNEWNTLDQKRFPVFYAKAGAHDTQMMWEWGTGYRFTKIEGFYDTDSKELSIHTGSTVEGTIDDESTYIQGVDAYRDIVLDLTQPLVLGTKIPAIHIQADFNQLLSGKVHTITLSSGTGPNDNATSNVHTAVQMTRFVDNLGGNGTQNKEGMFSIFKIEN